MNANFIHELPFQHPVLTGIVADESVTGLKPLRRANSSTRRALRFTDLQEHPAAGLEDLTGLAQEFPNGVQPVRTAVQGL